MYQCPFDMPVKSKTCTSAIFDDDHVAILNTCKFQINPLYEKEIVRELSPGRYLMSMRNTTWTRQCGNVTEELDSCLYCEIQLDCGCQLQAGQYHLSVTFEPCVKQAPTTVKYVYDSSFHYFMAPDQYLSKKSGMPRKV